MSKNDITGDRLISKTNSKQFEDNYDLIFKKSVLELDSTTLDNEDDKVGHNHATDEELFNTSK